MGTWPEDGIARDGVRLRRWRAEDAEQRFAIHDAESLRWSPPMGPRGLDAQRERIEKALAAEPGSEPLSLAVVDDADPARVLGDIDVRPGPPPPFSVRDVGYAVLPAARGRGIGSTALRLHTEWLLDPDGGDVLRVQLDHAVEHVASCRTALRAGFGIEGRRARFLPLQESPDAPVVHHDVCLHGRVRD